MSDDLNLAQEAGEEVMTDAPIIHKESDVVADYGADNVADILGLTNKKAELIRHDQSVVHYSVDMDVYDDIYGASKVMQNSVNAGMQELKVYDKLNSDMFLSLFKYKPEIRPQSEMKKSTKINRKLMEDLVDTPEYRRLRQNTKLDIFNSALGSEMLGEKAVDLVKELRQKIKDRQNQKGNGNDDDLMDLIQQLADSDELINQLNQNAQQIQSMINQMKQGGGSPSQQLQDAMDQATLDLQTAQAIADQLADALEDQLEENDDLIEEMTTKMVEAMSDVGDEVADVNDLVGQWGLQGGEGVRIPFASKKDAIERIRRSKELKKLTDLIGRFKEMAMRDQKQKTKNGASSIKSVTTGNNITAVLPSEKMKLAHKATKMDFYRRYNQKELLTYELENTNKKGKGPMIVCIDSSGSMDGKPEQWSKAMAIALLEVAQMQKRNFAAIIFESKVRDVIVIEKGELDPNKVVDIAEKFYSGGTDFEAPLEASLKLINDSKFKKADIVFITDGECGISSDFVRKFNETKEIKEFSCMSVLINVGRGRVSDSTLKSFSDSVVNVSNLADLTNEDSDVAHQIFQSV